MCGQATTDYQPVAVHEGAVPLDRNNTVLATSSGLLGRWTRSPPDSRKACWLAVSSPTMITPGAIALHPVPWAPYVVAMARSPLRGLRPRPTTQP